MAKAPKPAVTSPSVPPPKLPIKQITEDLRRIHWLDQHGDEYRAKLLQNIKQQLPKLEQLLAQVEDHWGMEDGIYRFYHNSFKVFRLQVFTEEICQALQALLPDRRMNKCFSGIVKDGTGHQFEMTREEGWLRHTRAILEACFHAHYFLKMVCKYGRELEVPPDALPSGWASVLYLFDLR
jgi:hypothetical protein